MDNNGSFVTINDPVAASSATYAVGINNSGQVAGYYWGSGGWNGFVETNGTFITIDDPAATWTVPWSVNDNGQVAGYYTDASGYHGFVATSTTVPEPASLALLGTGVLGLTLISRRKIRAGD